ncbi:MAG TPA: MFS transporter [Casimicrobiaceae bacterium]|jgi:MFS family permease|nr:MFS transporter [Casimicrobiaceae bacterium]
MTGGGPPPRDSILAERVFLRFWCGRLASVFAYQMLSVAVGWQVYALSGSALDLGLIGLAQFAPSVALMLVVGHVADRFDRRRIVRTCQWIEGGAIAVIAVATRMGEVTEAMLFALVFVVGAARAFEFPTVTALLPFTVSAGRLPRAVALSSTAGQVGIVLGPALGGFLYVAGAAAVYATCAALFVVASILIGWLVPVREAEAAPAADSRSVFAGIRFIRGHPALFGAISLDLFAVLLGGATALLPVYARDILHTGPWGLGLLRSAPAVGALATALWLARHPIQRHAGRRMFIGVAAFGAATIVFGLSRALPLSLAALVVLGAADMQSVVVRQSLFQLNTPDHMRGRVSAVNAMFIGASNQLGEFESGVTAAWLGTVPAVLVGGLGTLAMVALWIRIFPALARVDRLAVREQEHSDERPA